MGVLEWEGSDSWVQILPVLLKPQSHPSRNPQEHALSSPPVSRQRARVKARDLGGSLGRKGNYLIREKGTRNAWPESGWCKTRSHLGRRLGQAVQVPRAFPSH